MKRRNLLKGLAVAPIAFLFPNGADAFDEKNLPIEHKTEQPYTKKLVKLTKECIKRQRPFGVTDQMQDLIQKAGDKDASIAFPAQKDIIEAMKAPFRTTVIEQLEGNYWYAPDEFADYEHEYAVAGDIKLQYLRDCRWDILTNVFTSAASRLASKINAAQQHTLISEIHLCDDPCCHKVGRFGFYAYVELS
jgi:hypothetical protein